MTIDLATATRDAKNNAAVGLVDAGAGVGRLRIYTGSKPAVGSAPTGVLLIEFDLADPAWGGSSGGTAELAGTPRSAAATDEGEGGYFRIVDGDGTPATVFQGTVTQTGGGGDITLDNTNIAIDQQVNITALDYTQPEGA